LEYEKFEETKGVIRRRINNTITKRKMTTLSTKHYTENKIQQHEPHKKWGVLRKSKQFLLH
jgi:hypothetical protein